MNYRFLLTGLLVFGLLTAYFFDRSLTPNPVSRLLPVVTFVEDGAWRIDRLKDWTEDKAKIGDHYYTEKAPLSSWLVVPFDFVYTKIARPSAPYADFYVAFSFGILLCGVLPFLFLIATVFYELGVRRRSPHAVWLSTLPLFGSPLSVYAGTYFGHLLAGAFVLAAWLAIKWKKPAAIAGVFCGLAVLSEYPTAILVCGLAACVWLRRRSARDVALFCLGGLPALAALLIYDWNLTGSPLRLTYGFVDDTSFQFMKTAYGFNLPSATAMLSLLAGPARGLLIYVPAIAAIAWSSRKRPRLWRHPLTIATVAFFVCISSYKMYGGGWAFGPRYLMPALFIVFYEGLLLIDQTAEPKWPLALLSVFGVLQAWLANATVTYMIPENIAFPLRDLLIPDALAGKFNANNLPSLLLGWPPSLGCLFWPVAFGVGVMFFDRWYRVGAVIPLRPWLSARRSSPAPVEAIGVCAPVSSTRDLSAITVKPRFLEPTHRKLVLCGVAVFVVSLAFMLWGIAYYDGPIFDETWYVAAARALLRTGAVLRPEHPPLAQLLIAAGMRMFGDDSLGWRAMSAIFGSLTLVAMFFWSFALLRNIAQSIWVTVITLFDQCLYVQARIATLDVFVMAFCTLALAFFTVSLKEKRPDRSFRFAILMGVSLGLAASCKWSGLFLLSGIAAVALLFGALRLARARFEKPKPTVFFAADVWTWLTPWKALLVLALVPWLTYTATYIPQMLHAGSIVEFITAPYRMLQLLDHVRKSHPYSSRWFQWPVMVRPTWYLFQVDDPAAPWSAANPVQAIVALVNPVVLAAGEIALVFAAVRFVARRDINAMIVTVGFSSQYLPWAFVPRSTEFFYYYFPAVLCLGPALGLMLFRRGPGRLTWPALALLAAAGLCFAYFMPILSAHIGLSPHGYKSRIWFSSWR